MWDHATPLLSTFIGSPSHPESKPKSCNDLKNPHHLKNSYHPSTYTHSHLLAVAYSILATTGGFINPIPTCVSQFFIFLFPLSSKHIIYAFILGLAQCFLCIINSPSICLTQILHVTSYTEKIFIVSLKFKFTWVGEKFGRWMMVRVAQKCEYTSATERYS